MKQYILICMAFMIFDCGGQNRSSAQCVLADGKIVSVTASRGPGMRINTNTYDYTLREESGKVLLDAHYYIHNSYHDLIEIDRKDVEVSLEDMEALRRLCDTCDFVGRQKKPHKLTFYERKIENDIRDAPYNTITVIWENGAKYRESGYSIAAVPCRNELQKFFRELVEKIMIND